MAHGEQPRTGRGLGPGIARVSAVVREGPRVRGEAWCEDSMANLGGEGEAWFRVQTERQDERDGTALHFLWLGTR